jgi:hypothetical protein
MRGHCPIVAAYPEMSKGRAGLTAGCRLTVGRPDLGCSAVDQGRARRSMPGVSQRAGIGNEMLASRNAAAARPELRGPRATRANRQRDAPRPALPIPADSASPDGVPT